MDFARKFAFILGIGSFLSLTIMASDTAFVADNPYASVVARNMFGLLPIPTNPPPAGPPADPPPKITPNGTMSLFGELQVLFKVSIPPKPGQPPHDESYTLSEGERQDDIEVIKIDQKSSIITFDNHGTIQELPLANASNISSPASSPSGPGGSPNMPMRPSFGGRLGGPRALGGRFGQNNNFPGGSENNSSPAMTPAYGSAPMSGGNNNPQSSAEGLSPEAQALLIEQNYINARQNNSPTAALYPPTALRPQSDASLNGNSQ